VDPLSSLPHDPDIRALLRVCNVHNVPLATNVATADLIISGMASRNDTPQMSA
jgi:methylglyoxal synthase